MWSQWNLKRADRQGEELSDRLGANLPCSLAALCLIGLRGQLGWRAETPIDMRMCAHRQHSHAGRAHAAINTHHVNKRFNNKLTPYKELHKKHKAQPCPSEHTHTHIWKHITPTFKQETPTHIKSHTLQLWAQHRGLGSQSPPALCLFRG